MKNKYADIQNKPENIDLEHDWRTIVPSNPNGVLRLGTSFSGIGAIEQALKKMCVKTKIMFAGDIDENCKKAYFANYDIDPACWHSDVHDFNATPYKGQVDLFVGGAPCQAFSLRGKHGGFEDTRGTLFREFARIVLECQPKVFIFENVRGMLSHDKGRTWRTIKETFEESCDYDVYYQVLNGKDYGIPQSRDRLFCIGFKKETAFKYPAPIPLTTTVADYLENHIERKYFLKAKGVNFITRSINHEKSYTQINGKILLCQKRNQQFNWHGDFVFYPKLKEDMSTPECEETLFRTGDFEERYFLDRKSTFDGVSLGSKTAQVISNVAREDTNPDYGRYRKLTPRECLRLMGFDDNFRIVCSDAETYKQAGNSIIVNVLEALLKQLDITQYAE
jgi:DNA (cytosine-5)-methyltransferase 1